MTKNDKRDYLNLLIKAIVAHDDTTTLTYFNSPEEAQEEIDDLIEEMELQGMTINPWAINYFDDDFAKEYLWIIDEEGNHINMGADNYMLEKLTVLGPGEVVCDDYRTFKG